MRATRLRTINTILWAILSCSITVAWAQQSARSSVSSLANAQQEVRNVEALRLKAFLDHDVKAMSGLLADEMLHTTTTGKTRNKTEFMDDFANRPTAFSQFVTDDMEVIIVGDVAVTRGRYHNVVAQRSHGTSLKYARFLRVWAKRNDSWQLVSHQATEVEQSGN